MSDAEQVLRGLLAGPVTLAAREETILQLLGSASAEDLNAMLDDGELVDRLVARVDDHLVGSKNRQALFELIERRAGELTIRSRATIIHALQTGPTPAASERLIASLLMGVRGDDLTQLKNLIDLTWSYQDIEKLIFADIDDAELREQILQHFSDARVTDLDEVKVLSDIDDTTISSLKDTRFPKGLMYPGVTALWEALDAGPSGQARFHDDLTFVTARPTAFFGLVENLTQRSMIDSGVKASSMLSGTALHLFTHGLMAERKIDNIDHYRRIYPEYRFVFIGDSGQGDIQVGQQMLKRFPEVVSLVLIHDVMATPPVVREEYASQGIHLFDTYVRAAGLAWQHGLIHRDGLDAVIEATTSGFDGVEWSSPAQEAQTRALLAADLEWVQSLPDKG